jgi:excisionase family DNA binding protein
MGHQDQLLTVKEVAERLRVSRMTISRWIKDGSLRSVRVGHGVRFRPADVEQFIEDSTRSAS